MNYELINTKMCLKTKDSEQVSFFPTLLKYFVQNYL